MFKRLYYGLTEGQRQFIEFSFVGGVGFIVDAGTFHLLIHFTPLGLITARFVSSLVFGMSATYTLNRYLTFRDRRSDAILTEYLRFASANIVGNLLNIGTHSLLVETLPLFHAYPILGIIAGTAVGLMFNFTLSKYFVFKAAKPG